MTEKPEMKYTTLTVHDESDKYYWTKPADECVAALRERIEQYYGDMNRTGRVNLYRNSYYKFYQGFILKGELTSTGQVGELTATFENHYANLITHGVNMVCQQKLSYEPQTTTTDAEAQDQIKRAKGILNLYTTRSDKDLDGQLRKATEMSYVFDASWVSVMWNKDEGRTIAGDFDQQMGQEIAIKEGDIEFAVWSPFDVILDPLLPSYDKHSWIILRKWENKYNLAARFPKWADRIRALSAGIDIGDTRLTYTVSRDESDIIPIYHAFHKDSPALPNGRYIIFIDDEIICADGKLWDPAKQSGYREIPLYRMAGRDLWGSPWGYSRAFDVLPLQETVDRLASAIATNQLTFATQNILVPKGSSISWENLYGGLNVIEWDSSMGEAGIPKALQLTSTPKEVFDNVARTVTTMGTIMGVNEVLRGNPDLALKGQISGASLALMTSNSIQFNSDMQKAYVRLAEQVGTAVVHCLQDFAFPDLGNGKSLEREGMTQSATQKFYKSNFSKQNISKIDKITIRYGNPLAQTTSGRLQIAETLLQQGLLTAQQYFQVIETGNLEGELQAQENQLHLIKEENEAMMRGEVPSVIWADNHALHIPEHMSVLSNLEARKDPKVIQAVQAHVTQHQQMMAPPPPPTPPGGSGGGPNPPPPPGPGPSQPSGSGVPSTNNVGAQTSVTAPKSPVPPR
jgi:hypothetical protein